MFISICNMNIIIYLYYILDSSGMPNIGGKYKHSHTFIKYNHILLVNYTIKYFISFIINGIFMYIYVCYILFISYLILYRKCNINAYNI